MPARHAGSGSPPTGPRLAAKYEPIPESPARRSRLRLYSLLALLALGAWGGLQWMGRVPGPMEVVRARFHRMKPHEAATKAPVEPATTRPDGRLVG